MKRKNDKPSIWRDAAEILVVILVFALLMWMFVTMVRIVFDYVRERRGVNELTADTVNEEDGAGRATASVSVIPRSRAEAPAEEEETALWVYIEGDGRPPEWWNPDEPMAVEWYAEDHFAEIGNMVEAEPHPPVGISQGGIDWNVESAIYGWDGHMMTGVELDLFSRVFMLEFWGTSIECCEAGADAILNLWDSGLYGRTLCECLWAKNEQGRYIYSVCNYLWDWDYDLEGLEWCKEFCLERFIEGPTHETMYFQLYGFHDTSWTIPLFECDGVYFSKRR